MATVVSNGSNFALTSGVDTFTGTANNDTFTADNTPTADASSSADTLDGGAGTDTLQIFSDGSTFAMPALTSVETLTIFDQMIARVSPLLTSLALTPLM